MPRARISGRLGQKLYVSSNSLSRLPFRHASASTSITRHASSFTQPDKYPNPALYDHSLLPPRHVIPDAPATLHQVSTVPAHIARPSVPIVIQAFPTGKPLRVLRYPSTHLHLPLRKDLLHRAIVFEGNRTRQGTHHTKWRSEVHKSGRKLHRQKGTGRARVGDAKSPIRKGGGVAHGPKDRDHSTGLPLKIYDKAWRTALSYRYRKGELVVIDGSLTDAWKSIKGFSKPEAIICLHESFQGSDKKVTTLYIGLEGPKDKTQDALHQALEAYSPKDRVRYVHIDTDEVDVRGRPKRERFVDVKNLLESSRLVIEKQALDALLEQHQSDLGSVLDISKNKAMYEKDAPAMMKALEEYRAARGREAEAKKAAREEILAERKKRKEQGVEVAETITAPTS